MIDNIENKTMQNASPELLQQRQEKPSKKAIQGLKDWRDAEGTDEWTAEVLDAVILKLENEVAEQ